VKRNYTKDALHETDTRISGGFKCELSIQPGGDEPPPRLEISTLPRWRRIAL
jgi:hypothetical protein